VIQSVCLYQLQNVLCTQVSCVTVLLSYLKVLFDKPDKIGEALSFDIQNALNPLVTSRTENIADPLEIEYY